MHECIHKEHQNKKKQPFWHDINHLCKPKPVLDQRKLPLEERKKRVLFAPIFTRIRIPELRMNSYFVGYEATVKIVGIESLPGSQLPTLPQPHSLTFLSPCYFSAGAHAPTHPPPHLLVVIACCNILCIAATLYKNHAVCTALCRETVVGHNILPFSSTFCPFIALIC